MCFEFLHRTAVQQVYTAAAGCLLYEPCQQRQNRVTILKAIKDYSMAETKYRTQGRGAAGNPRWTLCFCLFDPIFEGMVAAFTEPVQRPPTLATIRWMWPQETGTPETADLPNSTFICFAPADDPPDRHERGDRAGLAWLHRCAGRPGISWMPTSPPMSPLRSRSSRAVCCPDGKGLTDRGKGCKIADSFFVYVYSRGLPLLLAGGGKGLVLLDSPADFFLGRTTGFVFYLGKSIVYCFFL